MRYVVVATLLRGALAVPEPLDDINSLKVEEADRLHRLYLRSIAGRERDRLLSPAEWAQEEAGRARYVRRKRVA